MELRDYLRIFRRRWALIVVSTLLAVGSIALVTFTVTPVYQSTARLFVTTAGSGGDTVGGAYEGSLLSQQRVASYAQLVGKSDDLATTVIESLGLALEASDLRRKVAAAASTDTVLIDLTAEDPDPALAQSIAQAYAVELSNLVRRIEAPDPATDSLIRADVVDSASLPSAPVSPRPVRNLALAVVLGLLLGLALAIVREKLDASVKTLDDIAEVTDAPVLGAIAFDSSVRTRPLVSDLEPQTLRAEAFRVLRTNLQFVDVDAADNTFVVTSSLPGEGKTTTAVNLASTLAQAGQKTLLMECDLRRPKAIASLGLDHSVGVTTILLGKMRFEDAVQDHGESGLAVLASGALPPNPAELLQSQAMADLLKDVRDRFDVVIIDAPPLLPVTDAAVLATQVDGAIVVVAHGMTSKDQFAQARQRLAQVDADEVGVVLNMVPSRHGYGYGYGYGQYAVPTTEQSSRRFRRRRRSELPAAQTP